MTTELTWYPFPGRNDYEFSNEGDVRTSDGKLLSLQFIEGSDACYYSIPHYKLSNHFIHLSPDNIIDTYLPYYIKD